MHEGTSSSEAPLTICCTLGQPHSSSFSDFPSSPTAPCPQPLYQMILYFHLLSCTTSQEYLSKAVLLFLATQLRHFLPQTQSCLFKLSMPTVHLSKLLHYQTRIYSQWGRSNEVALWDGLLLPAHVTLSSPTNTDNKARGRLVLYGYSDKVDEVGTIYK
jgi:hypothetical protein